MSSIVLALVLAIFVAVTLILVVSLVFLITNRRKLEDYIRPSDTWYRTLLRSSRGRGPRRGK